MSANDESVNFDGNSSVEMTIEDKGLLEQVKLIEELEPEEKNILLKLIQTFVSKKRFKDYLQQNIAAL